jgi:hypothetical protein
MVPGDFIRLLETGRIELLNKLHGTRRFYVSFRKGRIELLNKIHGTRGFYASFRNRKN